MGVNRWWAGAACGAVLGVGAVVGLQVATPTAEAQSGFTVTPAQLQINQKISQAAVLRSNQALNYLAPIRTTQSDSSNTGKNGVTPLSRVTGSGQGWPTAAIANGAITTAKLANEAVTTSQIGNGAVGSAQLATGQRQLWASVQAGTPPTITAQTGGVTVTRTAAGEYTVGFGTTNVSQCSYSATVGFDAAAGAAIAAQVAPVATNTTQIVVRTVNGANTAVDASFQVQAFC